MNEPWAEQWFTKHLIGEGYFITVADPDLSDKGGGAGHPDSEIRGGPVSKKYFFSALWASFCSKNKGRVRTPWAPLLVPPLYYIAESPQASSTLIFGLPVVSWVSLRYLGVIIWIYVCQDDS